MLGEKLGEPGNLGTTAYIICFWGQQVSKVALSEQMSPVLQLEREELKRSESLQNIPEFVRVRGTLKRSQTFAS